MKRFLKHSGILLSAIAGFGLSFGVAHAEGGLLTIGGIGLDVVGYFVSYPLEILSAALATVLSMAGTLLDATIKLSLETSWYTNSPTKEIIALGWGIVRDFFNLTFIFILLYNGIRIILDLDQSPQAKKIAIDVLIAALLINFSLFFTQLIMDGSNMLAVGLYNSIQTVVNAAGAGRISEAINVTFANQAFLNLNPLSFDGFNKFINVILRIIFSGISIYVFVSVSFLFIGRFVAFFLLMITSPVWIAGALIPRLKSYQEKFQTTLFDQAMLAPVFLFFMYIILQVITSDIFVALSASGSAIPGGGSNKTGQVLVFAILAALLLIAKSEATKLSGEIGKTVNGYIQTGAGLALGGAAIAGRLSAGLAGQAFKSNATVQNWAKNSRVGGALNTLAGKAQNSSFDVRNIPLVSTGVSMAGLNLGKGGGEGGVKKFFDNEAEMRAKKAADLGQNDTAIHAQERIVLQNDEAVKEKERKLADAKAAGAPQADIDIAKAELDAVEAITKMAKAEIGRLKTERQKGYAAPEENRRKINSAQTELKDADKYFAAADEERTAVYANPSATAEQRQKADDKVSGASLRLGEAHRVTAEIEKRQKAADGALTVAKAVGDPKQLAAAKKEHAEAYGTTSVLTNIMRGVSFGATSVASAKVMLETIEKDIKSKEEKINELKPDIRELEKRARDGRITPQGIIEMGELKDKRAKIEGEIRALKLTQVDLENVK